MSPRKKTTKPWESFMTRRQLLSNSACAGSAMLLNQAFAGVVEPRSSASEAPLSRLPVPKGRRIKVAFLISDNFAVIDFAGPWEIFEDAMNPDLEKPAFELYTVSRSNHPVKTGGLAVVPQYTLENAPMPDVLVIPAQADDSAAVLSWIRKVAAHAQITMSVCTGAFLLAKAGILDGLEATTHHGAYKLLAVNYPHIRVQEKVRFVDNGRIATSSGLSAGIDLALHVVARYFGNAVAGTTAAFAEYAGYGWKNPHDTGDLFSRLQAEQKGRVCPVCGMGPIGADVATMYHGKVYYFCSDGCRKTFLKRPDLFVQKPSTLPPH